MRVLVFSWEYPPVIEGGLARHVGELSGQLAAGGLDVHVLTRGETDGTERHHGVTVHRLAQPPFPRELDGFLRWVAQLNQALGRRAEALAVDHRFDLVHSHDWLVADAARATARAIARPWLVTVHATEHGRHGGRVQRHPQAAIHAAEREMVRDADHLIVCSRYMQSQLARIFAVGESEISVLPNGVDRAGPGIGAARLASVRGGLAHPGQRIVLLAGRLVYEKGFHVALEALAPLVRDGGVRFVVAGSGPAEDELRHQARRLGLDRHGRFLGWVDDDTLRQLYRVSEVCAVPSLFEPFGIVALEAMAHGCPCIVADTGGLREIVPAGGRVGLRFGAGDAEALRAVLARALGDDALRARIAAAAREHITRYDWVNVAARTRELYARICDGEISLAH